MARTRRRPARGADPRREAQSPPAALTVDVDLSALAVVERLFVRTPIRLLRARNNALDQLFYDVDTIPAATRRALLRWSDPDGSIVVVHPGDARARAVEHFEHVDAFLASRAGDRVDVVALAGVGSSALGTAALAANVADALGVPVAGIVSGYGVVDALAEGLVGWFVLRTGNQLRQWIDAWLSAIQPLLEVISARTQPNGDPRRLVAYVRGLPETDALDKLLARGVPIATMVGHSKGNLCIATALDNLAQAQWVALPPRLSVVTLGALVQLPATLRARRQVIGALDAFGWMNSVLPQWPTVLPWATHTLNTRLPFHLDAKDALVATRDARPDVALRTLADAWASAPSAVDEWLRAWSGALVAVNGAIEESLRSLRQGAQHAASTARRGVQQAASSERGVVVPFDAARARRRRNVAAVARRP